MELTQSSPRQGCTREGIIIIFHLQILNGHALMDSPVERPYWLMYKPLLDSSRSQMSNLFIKLKTVKQCLDRPLS